MEAAEEALTYRDVTGLHRKLLPEDKDQDSKGRVEAKSDESNYVDLDMKPDCAKTVKVTFTGEGNQLSVIKYDGARQGEHGTGGEIISEDFAAGLIPNGLPFKTLPELPGSDQDSENETQRPAELDPSDCSDPACSDELQYTDMYLDSKSESDDGASAVLSDHCDSDTLEDESHYITTHEIQLTELDHEVDYDLGRETSLDFEDDNLVYSFVDYASFESDETQEGTLILEGCSQAKVKSQLSGAVVSTELEESDLCDSDKCASSDESVCKSGDLSKIHLSIHTSSRAANNDGTCAYTHHFGDTSHLSVVSSGARAGPLCDRAQYFIPAPGRQHLATKLRRKDINEYSSGASSSISELDDADKEVRNLTAKSFRSLACPYFDAINLSTSSESSMSEYGLNKWSAYVDWNYGNKSRGRERSVIAHKTSSATLEMNNTVDNKRHFKSITDTRALQTKMNAQNKKPASQQSSSSSKKEDHPKQRGVTLNFRCNVDAPAGARRPKYNNNTRSSEVTGTVLARSGCEMQYHHTDSMEDTHKRAIFASSLLKNVISKKMQFEQERKMERGEICDTYPAHSPCPQMKDQDGMKDRGTGKGLLRQYSETGSGFTCNSADELEGSRPSSCEFAEEQKIYNTPEDSDNKTKESCVRPKAQLSHSQSSAFNSWKEDEPEPKEEAEPSTAATQPEKENTANEELDRSSMSTKLLFVPSCQRLSKEKEVTDSDTPACPQKCEKVFKTGNNGNIVDKEENKPGGKTPEIKICLRSVKEDKGCTLNIANLLTPKISHNTVNAFRAAGDAKCRILSASDKIPNFTVRDIRDTKCRFQTPIYHVRDVRKLVKSSYRFVSLDNSDSKCSAVPLAAGDKLDEKAKQEPGKHLLTSPIVIKCHSVKTNVKSQNQEEADVPSETAQSENTPSHCSRGPPVVAKQLNPDQSDALKQRQEKFPGETSDRRAESKIPKQAALEKLKAAVKTMEQLYVFDRNEWKRKAQAPQPITDSHVLSLIASEEQGAEELELAAGRLLDPEANTYRLPQSWTNPTETGRPQEVKGSFNIIHVPYHDETFKAQQPKTFSNKSVLHFGNSNKAHVSISSVTNPLAQSSEPQAPTVKSSKTPAAPLSVKIQPPKHGQVEQREVKISPYNPTQSSSDSENYLTIPGLGYTNEIEMPNREPVCQEGSPNVSQPNPDSKTSERKRSPLIMEYPAAAVYHHPAERPASKTQQVIRFSPSLTAVSPTSSSGETVLQTQRKMLLDPTTGHYYLVDTPIHATTKRLFDPETGQYVDVPHSPVAPITPVTPVPLSLSPLALNPGAYAPTYMIYPGFIPSPTVTAQALLPQSPCHSDDGGGKMVKSGRSPNAACAESIYYSATADAPHGSLQLPVSLGHVTTRGGAAGSNRKPIISITTQQGPRIIAPPSFDGTTMSFVLEHR